MRISFFELEPFEREFFKRKLSRHDLRFEEKPLTSRSASKHRDAQVLVIFIFSKITASLLDKFPDLKTICTMSTGYDHIDLQAARERGIKICTVPAYGQNTVAEHAFALLQALNRNIIPAVNRTRACNFDFRGLMGVDLEGKTLGIVGSGKIGQYMIRYGKAFGMKIIAYDKFPNKELAKKMGFRYVSLATLCEHADFISLHLPLLPATQHLIGKEQFDLMQPHLQLINTSRGGLIDTSALIDALERKKIRGAALDVLELENDLKQETKFAAKMRQDSDRMCTLVENHNLLHRDNVLVTPHLAFYTEEALERIMNTTIENIRNQTNMVTS